MYLEAPASSQKYKVLKNGSWSFHIQAEVAHLVEHDLAKVGVAGSSPVFRSKSSRFVGIFFHYHTLGWWNW